MARSKVHFFIIDPENDFMDITGAALPVPGARADAGRLATLIERGGHRIHDFSVTVDSHHEMDIAHPMWWNDQRGNPPNPFTIISADEVRRGIWRTSRPDLQARSLGYVEELEQRPGQYQLCIWPPHCLIGSWGCCIQDDLFAALRRWTQKRLGNIRFVTKGSDPWTEHYGALMAEVPDPQDPSTGLNTDLLHILQTADVVAVAGWATSHCVKETVNQTVRYIGDEHIRKFCILTDCTSPVAAIPGADFPVLTRQWLAEMRKLGVNTMTSEEFLNQFLS